MFCDRRKSNLDWKNQNLSPQSGQATVDMVPESDSHWSNSSPLTSQHGSQPDVVHTGNSHPTKKRSTTIEPVQQPVDEAHLVQIATEAFVRELGLEDDAVLKDGKVQIREVPAGTYLMKEESHKVKIRTILPHTLLAQVLNSRALNFSTAVPFRT